jgi:peptidoglycan/LPS O-acetylase OafA/YrhL
VTAPRHWPELDGLRGLAILLVIPHNVDRFGPVHDWTRLAAIGAHLGWIGVQLFFVLSGFLITRNLLDSRGSPRYYSTFYARRALRILPLCVATLVFLLLVLPRLVTLPPRVLATYDQQVWLWTFLSNWAGGSGRGVYWFPHFWSLAVEEQFYVVWPFVVALAIPRRLVPVCAALVFGAILARCVMLGSGSSTIAIYENTLCRMDALALGAIAAVAIGSPAWVEGVRRHSAALLAVAVAALAATAAATQGFDIANWTLIILGFTILAAAFAAIVLLATTPRPGVLAAALKRLLAWAPLRSVGRYSYAMYLFHQPIALASDQALLAVLKPLGTLRPIAFAIVIALASYAAGFVSYHVLEKRALGLKRYFVP